VVPNEDFLGGWWSEITKRFPWLEQCPYPSKPAQALITCMKTETMKVIKQVLETKQFPNFFEMIGFNDLAKLAMAWESDPTGFHGEVRKCRARAYTAQMKYCGKSVNPFAPSDLAFPLMSYVDPDKCGDSTPVMWHKAIKQPPTLDLRNLQKVWSAGRPYLKCSCKQGEEDKDCPGGPLWLDHAIWYLLAHPDVLFPTMSSIKVRTSMLVHYLRNTWQEAVIGCITFLFVREIMMNFIEAMEHDPQHTAESVIRDERLWRHQLPPALVRLLLPRRIPDRPRKVVQAPRNRNPIALIPGQGRLNFQATNRGNEAAAPAAAPAQPPAQEADRVVQHAEQRQQQPIQQQAQQLRAAGSPAATAENSGRSTTNHAQAAAQPLDVGTAMRGITLSEPLRPASQQSSQPPILATPVSAQPLAKRYPQTRGKRRSPEEVSEIDSVHSHLSKKRKRRNACNGGIRILTP
ncbi:hypothetical protein CBR_g76373, partial [Chara braunii]